MVAGLLVKSGACSFSVAAIIHASRDQEEEPSRSLTTETIDQKIDSIQPSATLVP